MFVDLLRESHDDGVVIAVSDVLAVIASRSKHDQLRIVQLGTLDVLHGFIVASRSPEVRRAMAWTIGLVVANNTNIQHDIEKTIDGLICALDREGVHQNYLHALYACMRNHRGNTRYIQKKMPIEKLREIELNPECTVFVNLICENIELQRHTNNSSSCTNT